MVSRTNKADMWRNEKKRLAARANVFMLPYVHKLWTLETLEDRVSSLKRIFFSLRIHRIFSIFTIETTRKDFTTFVTSVLHKGNFRGGAKRWGGSFNFIQTCWTFSIVSMSRLGGEPNFWHNLSLIGTGMQTLKQSFYFISIFPKWRVYEQ